MPTVAQKVNARHAMKQLENSVWPHIERGVTEAKNETGYICGNVPMAAVVTLVLFAKGCLEEEKRLEEAED